MATLEKIQAKMKQLQAQADALISKKAQAAIDKIRALMLEHGLTTEDIEAKASAKRAAKGQKVSAAAGRTKVANVAKTKTAPKYQHPKTGATWTGHGRAPAWIAEAKDRSKFLIAGGAEASVATTIGAESKAKAAGKKASKAVGAASTKGQPKGPQPAKYRDPKSGATWSGRGPAPAWLAGAKGRAKFLIVGASAAADAKPAVTKAVAKKAPTAKKTAAKKAVSAKVPAKKAPAKKAPRKSVAEPTPLATVEYGAELTS
ncbi:H-NS family nucleoid-associated regulatory protein [Paraburkholderia aromaticivorans]|uniref:Histone n=1 Tax=Paraburkholderia aromaticivorans TaxID=2026199 RepID=A0A248VE58_9BURK|nr:H-NS family nucleoid-associated regulatory protein [Paraburkholderia aromaticivorans]ASV96729.1 histone [Paraburkholderia aromaticivorans]